ncbi:bifunctional UDP-4-keto-pentose/UDP-xylose synthase [Rhodothermus sp. AH-315-K08]|nr:bifunctional UDP-4-keto-pentose/UDP-xylose synthase [Rhodothermus sp. AH-315-K08]
MKVLILGANGFIGNALVKALLQHEDTDVFAMDLEASKLEHSISHPRFHFVEGDINISNEWIEYHIRKCEVIVPLVAIATPNVYVTDPLKVFHLDFEANLKIVKWAAKYGKRLVFPSTSEVYGMCGDERFHEYKSNLVVGPVDKSRWIYSCSKQLLDRVIVALGDKGDLSYTLFRPFNWIGPRLDSLEQAQLGNGRVLAIFISNLLYNQPLVLVNGGSQKRAFTYIDDGIDALVRIVMSQGENVRNRIFNIGNPENSTSIRETAEILIREYEVLHPGKFTEGTVVVGQTEFYNEKYEDIEVRVPDVSEAMKWLGWSPTTNIDQALRKTLQISLAEHHAETVS